MKKFLTYAIVLGSTLGVAACASTTGSSEQDETRTQAPYAEERTVGSVEAEPVQSAEPVFERRQVK